jgi:hypothetical protein
VISFAEEDEGFIDVSNFDGSKSGEERSDQGNFIIGQRNHRTNSIDKTFTYW